MEEGLTRTREELKEKLGKVSSTCLQLAKSVGGLSAKVVQSEEEEAVNLLRVVQRMLLDVADKADDFVVYGEASAGDDRGLYGRAPLAEMLAAAWRAASGCWKCFHHLGTMLAEKVVPLPSPTGEFGGQYGGSIEVTLRVADMLLTVTNDVNRLFVLFSSQDWAHCGRILKQAASDKDVVMREGTSDVDVAAIKLQQLSHEVSRLHRERDLHSKFFAVITQRDGVDGGSHSAEKLTSPKREVGGEAGRAEVDKKREKAKKEGDNKKGGGGSGQKVGLLRRLLSRSTEPSGESPPKDDR